MQERDEKDADPTEPPYIRHDEDGAENKSL